MLQRAASNAYSWWWASHIRTKQSKWMEQNLQDMEEKVQTVLRLLEEEGDSFGKRAEMYYKRRPELIIFVEEAFRAYRSLADRYDHLSTELQNANNTIASVCPDSLPYMDEDDDEASPRPPRKMPEGLKPNVPKVPAPPMKDLKSVITTATKKLSTKKASTPASKVPKSGLSRKQAIEEVDKLQKNILALQTVKEFLKSSYDNSIAKYWETEGQIKELQERVSNLQDELGEGVVNVIDDEEARHLMAEAALKSCQDALSQLEEKQAVSLDEAKIESKRVKEVREKLSSLMNEFQYDQTDPQKPRPKRDVKEVTAKNDLDEDVEVITQQRQELQILKEKIKEHFEAGSHSALTVTEMAEKIDELVTKVISLESAVSSQTALVKNLKGETDELHSLIRRLEMEKESLVNEKVKLNEKLREMDEKVHELHDLSQVVEDQNNNLQTHFTEAHCSLDNLAEKVVHKENPNEDDNATAILPTENHSLSEDEPKHDVNTQNALNQDEVLLNDEVKVTESQTEEAASIVENKSSIELNENEKTHDISNNDIIESRDDGSHENDNNQISSETKSTLKSDSGEEATTVEENALLSEYRNTLQNYEEVKSKLHDVEKKTQDALFESSLQVKELKTSNAVKDEEIRLLRQKLNLFQKSVEGNEESEELSPVQPPPENHVIEAMFKLEEPDLSSVIEEKFRMGIDELLEENLVFWMKFSASFTEIQKYETTTKDLLTEVSKIEEKWKATEGSSSTKYSLKSDARPLYKHLAEIQNELTLWLENSAMLKEELQQRFSSLCEIQEEITTALKASAEGYDFKFTSYNAAKFQGEVLNMKQENNKVADELQAGLDLVTTLQLDAEKALAKLNERFGLSNSKRNQMRPSDSKNRVPLRSFIFGVKQKKQKQSIFSMHRKYRALKS
ncbi:protein NETWORKED 2D-like [Vicia villosa]|uniref:protein NETWORKED 2D-like n=1 Tax=Vicia villosa TaxID=3911 RepID=UPI00273AE68A|nr:protein NETWORKED 2D-like [Vicia villosa]